MLWGRFRLPAISAARRRDNALCKKLIWNKWKKLREPDGEMEPFALIDFSREHDVADALNFDFAGKKGGWRVSDDETIGGYSRASFGLVQNTDDLRRLNETKPIEKDLEKDFGSKTASENKHEISSTKETTTINAIELVEDTLSKDGTSSAENFTPFVRWKGNIDSTLPNDPQVNRSGFCAIRSPSSYYDNGLYLGNSYNALEIMCRTDGRTYTVNLKASTFVPDDLYQGFINVSSTQENNCSVGKKEDPQLSRWDILVLPFSDFSLTAFGRMREIQRTLDDVAIQYVGFTLADGIDGPFQFDLARIRAINYYDD